MLGADCQRGSDAISTRAPQPTVTDDRGRAGSRSGRMATCQAGTDLDQAFSQALAAPEGIALPSHHLLCALQTVVVLPLILPLEVQIIQHVHFVVLAELTLTKRYVHPSCKRRLHICSHHT